MKRIQLFVLLYIIFLGFEISAAMDFGAQTGFNFDWWDDNEHNRARQFLVPITLEARYKDFSVKLLTGETYTQVNPTGSPSRSLTHVLDTKVNFSYEIFDKLPLDVLIGLDFNLPTGKTNLRAKDMVLLMDPDLITINKFGEGFNINPTVSFAKEWRKWVLGMGIGYIWRGKYDFGYIYQGASLSTQMKDYDPGNIFNLTAEVRYDFSPHWNTRLFGNYVWYEKDKWIQVDNDVWGGTTKTKNSFQDGKLWLSGLGFQYKQKKWDADLTAKGIFRDKNKYEYRENWYYITNGGWDAYLTDRPFLNTERKNSHGDEWVADLSLRYFLNDKTTIKSCLQGRYITKNNYPSFSPSYVGCREKFSIGLGLTRILCPHLEGELYVKGFHMEDEINRGYPEYRNEINYRGFSSRILLTGRF